MKFIFADSLDYVDPDYDFLADRSSPERKPYWDDAYPHEILGYAPYDGVLVSRGIVGDHRVKGKYTEAQAMRFRLVGARKFLRLDRPEFAHLPIFGDCGAFTYVKEDKPPYKPAEIATFYEECGFTHGCSVDHIIFDFKAQLAGMEGGSEQARQRFDITLENAEVFLRESRQIGGRFTPLGVVQGWSPGSMAEAARCLAKMGYDYLALGGMVPLKAPEIRAALAAIREAVPAAMRLHILGFAKADEIDSFLPFDITSFDSTSPLIRAFKDGKQNYYLPGEGRALRYFTAIRVPQAIENTRLQKLVKTGQFRAEELSRLETAALSSLRAYDRGDAELEDALSAIMTYSAPLVEECAYEECVESKALGRLRELYRTTLEERPWTQCRCQICLDAGVEVIVFRASNRNKRRGIHNLAVFKNHIKELDVTRVANDTDDLFSCPRAAER